MEAPHGTAAAAPAPRAGYSSLLSRAQGAQGIHDSSPFTAHGPHPSPFSRATATSSPLVWASKGVNAGEGHLASQGKANIGTNLETGF